MKAKNHDVTTALMIIIQAMIVQLMEAQVISLDQGQRIFDGALKKASKTSPEAAEVVRHISDKMDWDRLHAASVARKRPR